MLWFHHVMYRRVDHFRDLVLIRERWVAEVKDLYTVIIIVKKVV